MCGKSACTVRRGEGSKSIDPSYPYHLRGSFRRFVVVEAMNSFAKSYRLYVVAGSCRDVRDPSKLLEAGISAVVDLALNEPPAMLPRELVYCRFPLIDGFGNPAPAPAHGRGDRSLHAAFWYADAGLLRGGHEPIAGDRRPPSRLSANALSPRDLRSSVLESGVGDISPGLWIEIQEAME